MYVQLNLIVTLGLIIIKIFLFCMPSGISVTHNFLENLQAVFSIFKVTRTIFELLIQVTSFNLNALAGLYETHKTLQFSEFFFSFLCQPYET